MASALEIGRQPGPNGDDVRRRVDVLVRPPLDMDKAVLASLIARQVFGDDDRHHSVIGADHGYEGTTEKARLGDNSQVLEMSVFDARQGDEFVGPDVVATRAVAALHKFVTAMAEGNTETLREFFPAPDPIIR